MTEPPQYLSFFTEGGEVLYREEIMEADALVFDVDGTLVSSSFDTTTLKTIKILFGAFTGIVIDERPLREALFKIKSVGGFANHWDVTYALFMGLMSSLDECTLKDVVERIEAFDIKNLVDLSRAANRVSKCKVEQLLDGVKDVVDYVDERGLISVDEAFDRLYKNREKRNLLMRLKELISYPGGPERSVLSRTFEELYYGGKRFEKLYGIPSCLKMTNGLFEEERLLLRPDTAKFLKKRFGERIGLLSGKRRDAARHVLGHILDFLFNRRARFFLEECKGRSKPDPKLLESVLDSLPEYRLAVYVGDSMEDLLLAKRSFKKNVRFIGIYGASVLPESCRALFLERGADTILPSVNDLKVLFG